MLTGCSGAMQIREQTRGPKGRYKGITDGDSGSTYSPRLFCTSRSSRPTLPLSFMAPTLCKSTLRSQPNPRCWRNVVICTSSSLVGARFEE